MISNNEQRNRDSSANDNVPFTPIIAPLLTPGGTKEWIPSCSNELKPALGVKFNNVDEGLAFYKAYAYVAGFNTRKSTTRTEKGSKKLKMQYILCNKEGYKEKRKPNVEINLYDKEKENNERKASITRKRLVIRVGCKAHMVNIGPVTTFRMMKEIVGGYDNIGASKQDFKIFHRDLKAYIQGSDAQIFMDNFTNKKLMWSAFFFDFKMDEDYCLCRALWAAPLCKKSYALFGDMVSFDTTYQTYRYNMVFTPFTRVNHHKSYITFAAGFIAKDVIVSFEWLFRSFLKKENGLEVAKVSEGNRIRTFDVVFNPTNYGTTCSCKLFYRQGIPCRHMIWVWKAKRFETIPEQYMLHRWTTMAMKKPIFDLGGNLLEQYIHTCVSLAEGKDEDIQDLVINLQGIRKDLEAKRIARNNETAAESANNKEQDIELLIRASVQLK
ncbi:protein FAR1-RELATED SEQUENCE 5-like [Chenopodium quinoa]|uniref:protein FAR1-RELATED SEQUENCE 5-like n=1 Tax=Chenopodium quinoa TaxID=63459 RepID=UPI000B788552|nr:protein FAR1-RELATED SEQUENCE 5-like [Chenopodium quinoa]